MTKTDHQHPVWQLLDKLQMDIRSMDVKLVELRAHIAGLELPAPAAVWQPAFGVKDPVASITRQIQNGVITDHVDLDAELSAHPTLTVEDRQGLRTLLNRKQAA